MFAFISVVRECGNRPRHPRSTGSDPQPREADGISSPVEEEKQEEKEKKKKN